MRHRHRLWPWHHQPWAILAYNTRMRIINFLRFAASESGSSVRACIASLIAAVVLSACGWVDATGLSSADVATSFALNDAATGTVAVMEKKAVRVIASNTGTNGAVSSFRWSDAPVEQGNLAQCSAAFADIETTVATDLQSACADPINCSMVFDEQFDTSGLRAEFLATAPELRAPVGVTYDLTTNTNSGETFTQSTTFCLQSENNEPVAGDDQFTVIDGQTLTVLASQLNLLSNDSDDIDNSNKPLRIVSTPVVEPTYASEFQLGTDGGFTYRYGGGAPGTSPSDSFVYELSDGINTSMATVTLSIVEQNQAPVQSSPLPALYVIAGVAFSNDLSSNFTDPEGASLNYSVATRTLPADADISLSTDGLLTGIASPADIGSYDLQLTVSDGSESITSELNLIVVENQAIEGRAPAIQNALVGERFTFDMRPYFTDPENQVIKYALLDNLSDDIEMTINSSTGRLTGFFASSGFYALVVEASDGASQPTSLTLVVAVDNGNSAPEPNALIANQTVVLSRAITPTSANFTDADNDPLTYALLGQYPAGISVQANGVLSGIPEAVGVFGGLRISATDAAGATAVSNAFTITVIASANTAPVYVRGGVFNQGITLGQDIRSLEPEFIDADDDVLTYSVIGATLPAGVTLNRTTGVVSGRPTSIGWTRNLRIVATDASGSSASSDVFWIRVR